MKNGNAKKQLLKDGKGLPKTLLSRTKRRLTKRQMWERFPIYTLDNAMYHEAIALDCDRLEKKMNIAYVR